MIRVENQKKRKFLGFGNEHTETSVFLSKSFLLEQISNSVLDTVKEIFPNKTEKELRQSIYSSLSKKYQVEQSRNSYSSGISSLLDPERKKRKNNLSNSSSQTPLVKKTPLDSLLLKYSDSDSNTFDKKGAEWLFTQETNLPDQLNIQFNDDNFTLSVGSMVIGSGNWELNGDNLKMELSKSWHHERFPNTDIQNVQDKLDSVQDRLGDHIIQSYTISNEISEKYKNTIIAEALYNLISTEDDKSQSFSRILDEKGRSPEVMIEEYLGFENAKSDKVLDIFDREEVFEHLKNQISNRRNQEFMPDWLMPS